MADTLADTAVNTANKYQAIVAQYATDVGMKILAAIVFWVVGGWLISGLGFTITEVIFLGVAASALLTWYCDLLAVGAPGPTGSSPPQPA